MRIFFSTAFGALFLVFGSCGTAFAIQTHGAPEGLYVHQLAHIFLTACMGVFAFRIYRKRLYRQRGWYFLALGAILLMIWNLWAFAGHQLTLLIPQDRFVWPAGSRIPLLHITSWLDILYYVTMLDHLFSVPALICFYIGLKSIRTLLSEKSATDSIRNS